MELEVGGLIVQFADDERRLGPDDHLVFGRGAELDIDSNPFLHRRAGRFVRHRSMWWVENLSSRSSLTVLTDGAATDLRPTARVALASPETVIRFEAGPCRYELRALQDAPDTPPPVTDEGAVELERTATIRVTDLPLTDEQRLLVIALAEHRLRDPFTRLPLPSNAEVAARLGWSLPKMNRKLDYLCQKLTRLGVPGLTEGPRRRANDRRTRVVDHFLTSGEITFHDLPLLDGTLPGQPADRG